MSAALAMPAQSDVERAFYDAMIAAGFQPGPIKADTDSFVRFDAPGDKPGRENGFYKLKHGRFPTGWFGDWKTGEQHQWHFDDGRTLTDKERKEIKAEQRRLKAEADLAREAKHREVAENASDIWKRAGDDVEGHAYLERKLVTIPRGLRLHIAKDGTRLILVPMWSFDHVGKPALTNLQYISDSGDKTFMKAGRVAGTFFSIKGDPNLIVICEGVATGFSIWLATGASVVCAFNGGNLVEVTREFARHRPHATLIVAGDDDAIAPPDWAERGNGRPWVNTGAKKAEAAAQSVGCRWVLPGFKDGPARGRTDFNDLHATEGEHQVKRQILRALRSEEEEQKPSAEVVPFDDTRQSAWFQALPRNSQSQIDCLNVDGVAQFIDNHRLLKGRLAFNAFTQAIELDSADLADHHVAQFRRVMHGVGFKAKKADVADEMLSCARRAPYDPLTDYLQGLKWDGTERLSRWLISYAGAEDCDYSIMVGRKWLVGAVARALEPGCKMDTMLVLEGEQGTGKSTLYRYLFGDRFFVDHLPDFHSKDSFMQLQGAWCVEVAELAALSKADIADVKQFLSRLVDKFRPPFGKLTVTVPRRVVFGGSVNPEHGTGYLRDTTGARRFWPVTVGKVALDAVLRDRDQIWAEAVHAYRDNEHWHLSDMRDIGAAQAEQAARQEIDAWEEPIGVWLVTNAVHSVTISEVLTECIKIPLERQGLREQRRVGAILRKAGWWFETTRPSSGMKPARVFHPADYQR